MAWNLTASGQGPDGDKVKQVAERVFNDLMQEGVQVTSFALTTEGVTVPLDTPGLRSGDAVAVGGNPPQPTSAPQSAQEPMAADDADAQPTPSRPTAPSGPPATRSGRSRSASR